MKVTSKVISTGTKEKEATFNKGDIVMLRAGGTLPPIAYVQCSGGTTNDTFTGQVITSGNGYCYLCGEYMMSWIKEMFKPAPVGTIIQLTVEEA